MVLKKIKNLIGTDFVEINLSFIPKYLSKYDSLLEDSKSLFYYYVLHRRKNPEISINSLGIIPSTFCNANCVFCANRHLKDKREIMSLETFKKVVDQFKEIGGKHLGITPTIGDVFTDPNLFDKVKYLEETGIGYAFYTNAILFDRNIDQILKSKIKDLAIDIGDIIPKYDAKVFQISESVSKKRLESILELLKRIKKRKSKLRVTFAFRSMRSIKKIFKDMKKTPFYDFYKDETIKLSFLQAYDNWGGVIKKNNLLGIQTLKRPPKIKKFPCLNLYTISILPNGDIRLCGCRCLETLNDELVIGNINETSLKDLTKSGKWKKVIREFKKGNLPKVCRNCSFYRPRIV